MSDAGGAAPYADTEIEMRFEPLEVTPQLLMNGLTLWGTPIKGEAAARLGDRLDALFELPWDTWPPTVGVSEISTWSEPTPFPTPWSPPEVSYARVRIFGYGFAPGVAVLTKWNNAFGFPDNGVGRNSILLQFPIPDANGRFAFQVVHRGVLRAAQDWRWEPNLQLVIVAQQGEVGTSSWREAAQRYIPPHVLWQWIPYWPVNSAD
jgi:hypothetical protein